MRAAVVDASVALSWLLPDEEASGAALRLLLGFQGGQLHLVAPSLWEYEIANALKVAAGRDRLSRKEARDAVASLLDLGVTLFDFRPVAQRAWQLALEYSLSIYDAAYVALAEDRRCEFYTADKRLVKATLPSGVVRWVGEFPSGLDRSRK